MSTAGPSLCVPWRVDSAFQPGTSPFSGSGRLDASVRASARAAARAAARYEKRSTTAPAAKTMRKARKSRLNVDGPLRDLLLEVDGINERAGYVGDQ